MSGPDYGGYEQLWYALRDEGIDRKGMTPEEAADHADYELNELISEGRVNHEY